MARPDIYLRTTDLGGASPLEAEILAFGLCNVRLQRAHDAKSRIEALHQNHTLWSALVRDLAGDGNQLPTALRQELIDLGLWAMRYGNAAIGADLALTPLIDVNRNILEGLKAQMAAAHPRPPAAAAPLNTASSPLTGFAANA